MISQISKGWWRDLRTEKESLGHSVHDISQISKGWWRDLRTEKESLGHSVHDFPDFERLVKRFKNGKGISWTFLSWFPTTNVQSCWWRNVISQHSRQKKWDGQENRPSVRRLPRKREKTPRVCLFGTCVPLTSTVHSAWKTLGNGGEMVPIRSPIHKISQPTTPVFSNILLRWWS